MNLAIVFASGGWKPFESIFISSLECSFWAWSPYEIYPIIKVLNFSKKHNNFLRYFIITSLQSIERSQQVWIKQSPSSHQAKSPATMHILIYQILIILIHQKYMFSAIYPPQYSLSPYFD